MKQKEQQWQQEFEKTKKQAKADIAKETNALLTVEDYENESFKTQSLFVAAMVARMQGTLMQHKKPEALYTELETYAKMLTAKLHTVWQKKHEALTDQLAEEELSQLEKAVVSWEPAASAQLTNFHEFKSAFLQVCPDKAIAKKHDSYVDALLKIKWQQYSIQQVPSELGAEAALTSASQSVEVQLANLSPEIQAALAKTGVKNPASLVDRNFRAKFSSVDWDALSPALAAFLHQNRLQVGSERVGRLAESEQMGTLVSGREDKLAPFLVAMCGALENDGEIQRCIREFDLSDNPKDTIRIIFASDDCRRAAYRVRQSPVIWTRFTQSLASIGLSLKDLKMDKEDEPEEEVDTETMLKNADEPELDELVDEVVEQENLEETEELETIEQEQILESDELVDEVVEQEDLEETEEFEDTNDGEPEHNTIEESEAIEQAEKEEEILVAG